MPDPITHVSVSLVVARHFFKKHKTLFLCSSLIPDIDGLVAIIYIALFLPSGASKFEMKQTYELFHPSLTASLFFLPFFVPIVFLVFRLVNKKLVPDSFGKAYVLVLTAMSVHLGLDMLMTGNRPFWPLPLEAGLKVIPYTTLGMVVPMLVGLSILAIDLLLFQPGAKKDL